MKQYLNKKWVLYGAGRSAILKYLLEQYKDNIVAIIDNDIEKQGKLIHGIEVNSVNYLTQIAKEDVLVIVTTYKYWDEISDTLCKLGWENNFTIAKRDIPFFDSYQFYLYLRGVDISTMDYKPQMLNLELSGICNCKCLYCPFHGVLNLKQGQKKLMTWETLEKVVETVKKIGTITELSPVGAGEILVHPEWYEMLQYYLNNVPTDYISFYTNGMLLTEENIIKISKLNAGYIELEISIDGRTPEENNYYRVGSDYEKIKRQIKQVARLKEEGKLQNNIHVVLTNCYILNEQELQEVDYKISVKEAKTPQYLLDDFPEYEVATKHTYVFYKDEYADKLKNTNMVEVEWPSNYNKKCANLFCLLAINFQGDILRCSCGSAGIKAIGSIFLDDVLDVWKNNSEMQTARKHFLENDPSPDFCEGCNGRGMGKYYVMLK